MAAILISRYIVQPILEDNSAGGFRYATLAEREQLARGNRAGFHSVRRIHRGMSTNGKGKQARAFRKARKAGKSIQ